MTIDGKNKPTDPNEGLRQLQQQLKEQNEKQRAENERNPNYRYLPPSYTKQCKAWANRDLWTLGESANLLAGTDPNRPIGIEGHDKLNNRVKTITDWLKVSSVRKEGGMLSKRYVAKEVVAWALEKEIPVPDDLLIAMGHKPKGKEPGAAQELSVHGNALANAKSGRVFLARQ